MTATPSPEPKIDITDIPEESRFEIYLDDVRVGFMDYALRGDTFTALHTEIDSAYAGHGLGERLVRHVLDSLRDSGMALRPLCPFVKAFIEKHPEYDDLVITNKGT